MAERVVRVSVTLADALGQMARPLAEVVAIWRFPGRAHRRARTFVRLVHPELARALDELETATADKLDLP